MEEAIDLKTPNSPPPPPEQQEPDPKKLKLSTTAAASDEDDATTKTERYKRRKIAIFFAYCGVGYQGMQKNPGAKTIEGDLEEALYLAGGVPEADRNKPRGYDWARSARTDKGVSAVGQVVSGRFYIDPPGFIDRINANLPDQIRIFGYKRVTGSFNAKKLCDRRRYVYLIPVFALDASSHPNRESVLASLGTDNELVKCVDCPERGRKVFGVMGKHNFESKLETAQSHNLSNTEVGENGNAKNTEVTSKEVENAITVDNVLTNGDKSESIVEIKVADSDCTESQSICDSMVTTAESKLGDGGKFSYGEKEKEKFNRILNSYVGSHNYHNFTTRTHAEDPAARRNIISFHANTVVNVNGIDFVKCEIVGQSFMLHQIRKMMGLAVAIMRGCAPESLIGTALRKDVKINVPTAPEVGLYLDECFFTSYNQKWQNSHEEVSMKAYEKEAEEFKLKHIYSHIGSTEQKYGNLAIWLHSLNLRNYPDLGKHGDLPDDKCTPIENEKCTQVENTSE